MRKIKNVLLAGILSICMIAGALPVELLAQEKENFTSETSAQETEKLPDGETVQETGSVQGEADRENIEGDREETQAVNTQDEHGEAQAGPQGGAHEIVSFEELPNEVKEQNVEPGTPVEELILPNTLTAVCRFWEETPESENGNDQTAEPEEKAEYKNIEYENTGNVSVKDVLATESRFVKYVDITSKNEGKGNAGKGDTKNRREKYVYTNTKMSVNELDTGDSEARSTVNVVNDGKRSTVNVVNGGERSSGNVVNAGESENKISASEASYGESAEKANGTDADTVEGGEKVPETDGDTGENVEKMPESGTDAGEGAEETSEAGADTEKGAEGTPESGKDAENSEGKSPESGADADNGAGKVPESGTDAEKGAEEMPEAGADKGEGEGKEPETGTDMEDGAEKTPETDGDIDESGKTDKADEKKEVTETLVIDSVTWISIPEYDAEAAGIYVFAPVLPDGYTLAEGVRLPEITVRAGEPEEDLTEEEPALEEETAEPACGTISADTTWGAGTLSDGTLTVEEGVTLTILGRIQISGNVTINGGGTIERGTSSAYFINKGVASLTIDDVLIDGMEVASAFSFISFEGTDSNLNLNEGCIIQNCAGTAGGAVSISSDAVLYCNGVIIRNCTATREGGAIYTSQSGKVIIDYAVIENCSTPTRGGAILSLTQSTIVINDGIFRDNKTTDITNIEGLVGGGFIYTCATDFTVNGGKFINNTAANKGGCIYHCGHENTITYLKGGYFENNVCTSPKYQGSGAVYNSTVATGKTDLYLSGEINLVGDGVSDSGTDGIYLDQKEGTPRKIWINDEFSYPVTIYVKAIEGYVIAEGWDYTILENRDMKKIKFVNVSDEETPWYPVLDKTTNQVKLSETPPQYMEKFFVFYIKNGAVGNSVKDDNNNDEGYDSGATTIVQSPGDLSMGENYSFVEWNTTADGKEGKSYNPGDVLTITSDIDLYAIWKEVPAKVITASFYSGAENEPEIIEKVLENNEETAVITAPELKEMSGWRALGWNSADDKYADGIVESGAEVRISEDTSYYGIYEKDVTVSYDLNYDAGEGAAAPKNQSGKYYANVHTETSYEVPEFILAKEPERTGYAFDGWNTEPEGSTGMSYEAGSRQKFDTDTKLYARWIKKDAVAYRVEHYCQNLEDEGYTRVDSDTQELEGDIGEKVTAQPRAYRGFTENKEYEGRVPSGIIKEGEELTLKLYYDRNTYKISFDLNYLNSEGGSIPAPPAQTLRYGGKLKPVTEPSRRGWSYRGWYKSREAADAAGGGIGTSGSMGTGTDSSPGGAADASLWDFDSTVEDNMDISVNSSMTLYAGWEDNIAPILGDASYNTGYKSIAGWLIRKKDLVITVPVIEEGSGVNKAEYTLTPDNGSPVNGETRISPSYAPRQVRRDETVKLNIGDGQGASIRFNNENGRITAVITVSEDYKGTVSLMCSDKAGNDSVRKTLTLEGGGIIVEDNAPEISFLTVSTENERADVKVRVSDEADAEGNAHITGGIAGITYQIDDKEPESITERELENVRPSAGEGGGSKDFQNSIVTYCEFGVEISGAGEHILRVRALDNAGNETERSASISIAKKSSVKRTKKKTSVIQNNFPAPAEFNAPEGQKGEFVPYVQAASAPLEREPDTGDESMRVEVYATAAMIAGLFYIFLYFCSGSNGMTEEDKNETVSKLVKWAKSGGRCRRVIAVAAIFMLLVYYHSIGRQVNPEWEKA